MYKLIILPKAQDDLYSYINTIRYQYDSPKTAKKHLDDLYNVFKKIRKNPEIYPIRFNQSFMQYGIFVRRVNYKKMAIIYTINNNTVTIQRVIASSLISQ